MLDSGLVTAATCFRGLMTAAATCFSSTKSFDTKNIFCLAVSLLADKEGDSEAGKKSLSLSFAFPLALAFPFTLKNVCVCVFVCVCVCVEEFNVHAREIKIKK